MLDLPTVNIIMQTSLGVFLVQIQGEGVEFPYRVKTCMVINAFSRTRLNDNITFYNPFYWLLFVEEISAWIENSEDSSTQSIDDVCKTDVAF